MTLEDMQFPREWFEDEVREGFFVPGTMKRSWAGQLVVLREIDMACKKLGIQWYMDCGTLLGAVRHKGFIPWDDDIDISMSRRDLEIFRLKAKEYLPKEYMLYDPRDIDEVETTVFRVVSDSVVKLDEEHLAKNMGCPFVSGIDIFPYENYLDSEEEENDRILKISTLLKCVSCYKEDRDIEKHKVYFDKCEELTGVDFRQEENIANSICQKINELYMLGKNENSEKVRILWSAEYIFERKWFGEPIMLSFEGIDLPAPAEYEKILLAEFGNKKYIARGAGHDYPQYGRQEKKILDSLKKHPFRYTYQDTDLFSEKTPSPRRNAERLLEMIQKLQATLLNSDEQTRAQILMNEQKLLMSLTGVLGALFNQQTEPADSIRLFGETIMNAFSSWQDDSYCILNQAMRRVQDEIKTGFDNRFDIVFLPCRATWWPSMETTWKYAKQLQNVNVYVCPISWYEEPKLGEKGACHDETDLFPREVNVTKSDMYDIAANHPAAVVIQVPYDNMNRDMLIDDINCSYRLKSMTDKLIYIPCFEPDTPAPDDMVSIKAMNELIEQPAVMFSDEIILPTAGLRDIYIQHLVELGGEEKRAYWEKKIHATDQRQLSMKDTVFH